MKKEIDIHNRVKKFILRVIKMTRELPKTPENKVFTTQIIRAAASVGANLQEADGAHTKADFLYSVNLSKKEAKETHFWLELVSDSNPRLNSRMQAILNEGLEISKILSPIILSGKKKI